MASKSKAIGLATRTKTGSWAKKSLIEQPLIVYSLWFWLLVHASASQYGQWLNRPLSKPSPFDPWRRQKFSVSKEV